MRPATRLVLVTLLLMLLPALVPAQTTKHALMREDASIVNPLVYNSGALTGATLQAAVTDIGSARRVLLLTPGVWALTSSLSVPANITLWVSAGATVTLANGVTLTLARQPHLDHPLWYSGAGTLALEDRDWAVDAIPSYVVADCLPSVPGSGVVLAALACRANLLAHGLWTHVVQASTSVTLPAGSDTLCLAVHRDTTTALAGWTRESGTAFVWQSCPAPPVSPPGGLLVAEVTVVSGNVTAVLDRRLLQPTPFAWVRPTDAVATVQATLDAVAAQHGSLLLAPGTYRWTAPVALKSHVRVECLGATLVATHHGSGSASTTVLEGSGVQDVTVTGCTFSQGGTWTATPFAHPNGGGNSIGFTDYHIGITLTNTSTRVTLVGNTFLGIHTGIFLNTVTQFTVADNRFQTLGSSAITIHSSSRGSVHDNTIAEVTGNISVPGNTTVSTSKFADGILLQDCTEVTVAGNTITDVVRQGVTLETGTPSSLTNNGIIIAHNTVKNAHGARGGELNAGVWVENGSTEQATVTQNTLDNRAVALSPDNRGIQAQNVDIDGNTLLGWLYGINATQVRIRNNRLAGNAVGVSIIDQAAGASALTSITTNTIENQTQMGVQLIRNSGLILVEGNTIRDNARTVSGATVSAAGILLQELYATTQQVVIRNNTFISSDAQGASVGQLYAIAERLGSGGLNTGRDTRYISNNTFLFTGTWSAVPPSQYNIVPVSFGWESAAGAVTLAEITNDFQGNISSKSPDPRAQASGFYADQNAVEGVPRFLGYSDTCTTPVSGTFRRGDYYLCNPATAGATFGIVCTASGTSGTWKGFGDIAP